MFICEYCGKEYNNCYSLAGHKSHCLKNPNKRRTTETMRESARKSRETYIKLHPEKYIKKEYNLVCEKCGKNFTLFLSESEYNSLKNRNELRRFCSKTCANSHKVSEETKQKISKSVKEKQKISKSHNQIKIIEKIKICKYCNKEYKYIEKPGFSRLYCSPECKHNYLSIHTGGKRQGSGRGKKGWYKGIYCDSSWELAYVIYHLDHNLNIKRCEEQRTYIWNNKEHTYIPDFITDEGIIEIKGYNTDQWKSKISQNPDIKVLYKKDIQSYINYCIKKYGNNFISLYDNSNPKNNMNNYNSCWFYKINDDKKLFIKVLVFKENYNLYLNNGWKRGGYSKKVYGDYKLICHKTVRHCKSQQEKERILSNLII